MHKYEDLYDSDIGFRIESGWKKDKICALMKGLCEFREHVRCRSSGDIFSQNVPHPSIEHAVHMDTRHGCRLTSLQRRDRLGRSVFSILIASPRAVAGWWNGQRRCQGTSAWPYIHTWRRNCILGVSRPSSVCMAHATRSTTKSCGIRSCLLLRTRVSQI